MYEFFSIHTDSDAVFHGESESVFGFKIRAINDELSFVFHKLLTRFFA
jgi:hypothetical protein